MNGGMKVEVHESDLTAKLFTSMLLSFDGIEPEGRTYINKNDDQLSSSRLRLFFKVKKVPPANPLDKYKQSDTPPMPPQLQTHLLVDEILLFIRQDVNLNGTSTESHTSSKSSCVGDVTVVKSFNLKPTSLFIPHTFSQVP
ncbi:hypothetical protein YC2023_055232 [Brassica napus]